MSPKDRQQYDEGKEDRMAGPEYFLYLLTPVQGRLYAYVMSRWPNRADADDIMQEIISILWRKFDTYEPGTEFLAWAFTIAKYVLSGFRRRNQRNPIQFSNEALDAIESQADEFISEYPTQTDLLRDCIGKLPGREATILKLKYEIGLTSQKIAAHFGMSPRTFYRALSKTFTSLVHCMGLATIKDRA